MIKNEHLEELRKVNHLPYSDESQQTRTRADYRRNQIKKLVTQKITPIQNLSRQGWNHGWTIQVVHSHSRNAINKRVSDFVKQNKHITKEAIKPRPDRPKRIKNSIKHNQVLLRKNKINPRQNTRVNQQNQQNSLEKIKETERIFENVNGHDRKALAIASCLQRDEV